MVQIRETPPESNGNPYVETPPDWESIFAAKDYTELVRPAQTARAKEYSGMVKSMLKSGVIGAINMGDFPDAAALLQRGPAFADAAGQFADKNDQAAKMIDLLCSPGSAPVAFIFAAIPLIMQLVRNHETALKEIPNTRRNAKLRRKAMADASKAEAPRFTVKLWKWQIPIRYRSRFKISKLFIMLKSDTQDPYQMTMNVFSDPKVVAALKKQGIVTVVNNDQSPT